MKTDRTDASDNISVMRGVITWENATLSRITEVRDLKI